MKKFGLIELLVVIVLIAMVANVVLAQRPFRASISMNAGSGTMTYTGVTHNIHYAMQGQQIIFPSTPPATCQVFHVVGTLTNLVGTKAILTATDRSLTLTNMAIAFDLDKVLTSSSDTNAGTAYFTGVEW